MGDPDLEKGFSQVDLQPDPSMLVAGMDATATWPAVQELRAWERGQLAVRPGESLIDVGCGLGDVTLALAPAAQPGGRVVGIDASDSMLAVARERAAARGLDVTFRLDDALALAEPDATFDVCRSERTLQWLPDLGAAVTEMVRVLRPGGRLCLIDSDWRTFAHDLGDRELEATLTSSLVAYRAEGAAAGGKVLNLCRDAGLTDIRHHAVAHIWTRWDPDSEPTPSGFFPLDSTIRGLVELGFMDPATAERLIDRVYAAARNDRFYMSLTMIGVCGRKP